MINMAKKIKRLAMKCIFHKFVTTGNYASKFLPYTMEIDEKNQKDNKKVCKLQGAVTTYIKLLSTIVGKASIPKCHCTCTKWDIIGI